MEGVDEEGLKEREVELEQRRIRKKERDDMYRCQLILKICCQIVQKFGARSFGSYVQQSFFRERNSREKGYSTGYIKLPCDRLTCEV